MAVHDAALHPPCRRFEQELTEAEKTYPPAAIELLDPFREACQVHGRQKVRIALLPVEARVQDHHRGRRNVEDLGLTGELGIEELKVPVEMSGGTLPLQASGLGPTVLDEGGRIGIVVPK